MVVVLISKILFYGFVCVFFMYFLCILVFVCFFFVIYYWELYKVGFVNIVKIMMDVVWLGDGIFDFIGYFVKYGVYMIFCVIFMIGVYCI